MAVRKVARWAAHSVELTVEWSVRRWAGTTAASWAAQMVDRRAALWAARKAVS